jgi:hypothetical protein
MPSGQDYFQDYAQVGGAMPQQSFYDNYAGYGVDPRVAGAYDMYYDAARQAGAYDYGQVYNPLVGGTQLQEAPYDWASQARYAGADAYAAPMMGAIGGGEFDLAAGKTGRKSYTRKSYSKTVKGKRIHVKRAHVKAVAHVKGQKKGLSKSKKSRSRSRSRSRQGGAPAVAPAWNAAAYDAYTPALVGGAADYLGLPTAVAGAVSGGKTGRKSFMRRKPGHKSKTVHVKAVKHVKGQKKGSKSKSKRSRSRSKSRSRQ